MKLLLAIGRKIAKTSPSRLNRWYISPYANPKLTLTKRDQGEEM